MTSQLDSSRLHTRSSLSAELRDSVGVEAGMTLLVHSSMKKIGGWITGGAETLIHALLDSVGAEGTLMMPTHTGDNSDPAHWRNPPVPETWWEQIRAERPPYDPATSVTWAMGILPENFRRWPEVKRSLHPIGSFAARGKKRDVLIQDAPLEPMFGEPSPIGRLYAEDGWTLLLGVTYENCTSLHLAEYRANFLGKETFYHTEGCRMRVEGIPQWVWLKMQRLETDDFEEIGNAFEQAYPDAVRKGQLGTAPTRLVPVRPLVDFAVQWMEAHRDFRALSF